MYLKGYRGFESLSLRHAVWTAENVRSSICEMRQKMSEFRGYFQANRTGENGLLGGEGRAVPAFLWSAEVQSGFKEGIRRMQCDQKLGIRP
jgi:hypothetical protein